MVLLCLPCTLLSVTADQGVGSAGKAGLRAADHILKALLYILKNA